MDDKDAQAIVAAKLYYEKQLSQSDVAKEMGLSRPTVAKLLSHAHQKGFVSITIHDPRTADEELRRRLLEQYAAAGLETVVVARPPRNSSGDLLAELAAAAAQLLGELVHDDMSIGVSWGDTMHAVSKACLEHPLALTGVEVVQLKGGTSHSEKSTHDIATIRNFCAAFSATAVTLPLPVIFDDATTKHVVEQDRHISQVLQAGKTTDLCVFTVGDVHREALLLNLGMLSPAEITSLTSSAVGDACSRFYNREGNIADPAIDSRTVGISLSDLASRPTRVLVAGGLAKTEAIAVALQMGLATHLVIDARTASRIVEHHS